MLESLELNSRDPRGRELYVRHHQVYSLLELNVRLHQLKAGDGDISELDRAIQDVSVLISELVTRFEEAAAPNHKASEYSETQISMLQRATQALDNLCSEKVSVTNLVDAARAVVAAGSQPRFSKPRLIVSNP